MAVVFEEEDTHAAAEHAKREEPVRGPEDPIEVQQANEELAILVLGKKPIEIAPNEEEETESEGDDDSKEDENLRAPTGTPQATSPTSTIAQQGISSEERLSKENN